MAQLSPSLFCSVVVVAATADTDDVVIGLVDVVVGSEMLTCSEGLR